MHAYEQAIKLETDKQKSEKAREYANLSFYHKNLGLAYYHQGNMEEAMNQYKTAIDYNEENADNYFNLGNVYLNQSQFDEAH